MTNPTPTHQQLPRGPSGDTLAEFDEGQWWLQELDAMVASGAPDQVRAVAVVRNLLRTAHATVSAILYSGRTGPDNCAHANPRRPYRSLGITGSDDRHYVEGPGSGFGYYAGTLYPEQRFDTPEAAAAAARCCNEAHRIGYARAQADMRRSMGAKE